VQSRKGITVLLLLELESRTDWVSLT
jgi:hypothetical protein